MANTSITLKKRLKINQQPAVSAFKTDFYPRKCVRDLKIKIYFNSNVMIPLYSVFSILFKRILRRI